MTSPKATLRRLLEAERDGVLATLSARHGGWPFASLVQFATSASGEPLLLLSDLAEHTRNLGSDPRASLLVRDSAAATGDPLAGARVTLIGTVERLDGTAADTRDDVSRAQAAPGTSGTESAADVRSAQANSGASGTESAADVSRAQAAPEPSDAASRAQTAPEPSDAASRAQTAPETSDAASRAQTAPSGSGTESASDATRAPATSEPPPVSVAAQRYVARHPQARQYLTMADFHLYVLRVHEARFVGGFGDMGWLAGDALRSALAE